jgi:hypothetical protein
MYWFPSARKETRKALVSITIIPSLDRGNIWGKHRYEFCCTWYVWWFRMCYKQLSLYKG